MYHLLAHLADPERSAERSADGLIEHARASVGRPGVISLQRSDRPRRPNETFLRAPEPRPHRSL